MNKTTFQPFDGEKEEDIKELYLSKIARDGKEEMIFLGLDKKDNWFVQMNSIALPRTILGPKSEISFVQAQNLALFTAQQHVISAWEDITVHYYKFTDENLKK